MESVSPAELCCHTLLIDDDTRHRSYCHLPLSHADVNEDALQDQAETDGLTKEIGELLQYLEMDGDVEYERMPAWDDFQEIAAEYGIEH